MAKKVKRRIGKWQWRVVEISGLALLLGGLVFLVYSLDAGIRDGHSEAQNGPPVLSAVAALFCGPVLTGIARTVDTLWLCSRCKKQLRLKQDKACLKCMVLLE